jgi:predicted transposase YdaD
MPYIPCPERQALLEYSQTLSQQLTTPGKLNFIITTLVLQYIEDKKQTNYTILNEVVGVLECVKLELYRRAVSPYEDQKIKEFGDVYPK